jgi:hypothetical protein
MVSFLPKQRRAAAVVATFDGLVQSLGRRDVRALAPIQLGSLHKGRVVWYWQRHSAIGMTEVVLSCSPPVCFRPFRPPSCSWCTALPLLSLSTPLGVLEPFLVF